MNAPQALNENLIIGKYYPVLDGFRGFAIVLVLWFHSQPRIVDAKYGLSFIARKYHSLAYMARTGVALNRVLGA